MLQLHLVTFPSMPHPSLNKRSESDSSLFLGPMNAPRHVSLQHPQNIYARRDQNRKFALDTVQDKVEKSAEIQKKIDVYDEIKAANYYSGFQCKSSTIKRSVSFADCVSSKNYTNSSYPILFNTQATINYLSSEEKDKWLDQKRKEILADRERLRDKDLEIKQKTIEVQLKRALMDLSLEDITTSSECESRVVDNDIKGETMEEVWPIYSHNDIVDHVLLYKARFNKKKDKDLVDEGISSAATSGDEANQEHKCYLMEKQNNDFAKLGMPETDHIYESLESRCPIQPIYDTLHYIYEEDESIYEYLDNQDKTPACNDNNICSNVQDTNSCSRFEENERNRASQISIAELPNYYQRKNKIKAGNKLFRLASISTQKVIKFGRRSLDKFSSGNFKRDVDQYCDSNKQNLKFHERKTKSRKHQLFPNFRSEILSEDRVRTPSPSLTGRRDAVRVAGHFTRVGSHKFQRL